MVSPECCTKTSSCVFNIFCSFTAEKQKSQIFTLLFPTSTHDNRGGGGKGDSANRVGDIRLHFQGVEGIELPQFPHLRRTEARNQCNQCCLSEPLIHAVRHASFCSPLYSHLYTLQRSCSHLFLHVTSFSPISFTLVVLPSC